MAPFLELKKFLISFYLIILINHVVTPRSWVTGFGFDKQPTVVILTYFANIR